jgi:hypothetical protein
MKKLLTLLMGLVLVSATSLNRSALAADPTPTTPTTSSSPSSTEQEMEFPMKLDKCTSDVKEFCSNITPGKGRVLFCLKSHDDKISQTCKDQIHEIMKEWKEFHQACKADLQSFCKTVQPGEGRMMACLKQHQAELSTECKALLK